mmetsp:Transcript_10220/g.16708  ORF Transcript_10220/g.16708 Transcript_10220/m.16708 type:complete len:179 (+) Transcript_10220:108-644(+)
MAQVAPHASDMPVKRPLDNVWPHPYVETNPKKKMRTSGDESLQYVEPKIIKRELVRLHAVINVMRQMVKVQQQSPACQLCNAQLEEQEKRFVYENLHAKLNPATKIFDNLKHDLDMSGIPVDLDQEEPSTNGKAALLSYYRGLRIRGLCRKYCPLCAKPFTHMNTFLSKVDRLALTVQ